jgi:hypothetical protein
LIAICFLSVLLCPSKLIMCLLSFHFVKAWSQRLAPAPTGILGRPLTGDGVSATINGIGAAVLPSIPVVSPTTTGGVGVATGNGAMN